MHQQPPTFAIFHSYNFINTRSSESVFDTSLADLPKGEWCQKISEIAEEHGHFQALGKHHFAAFVEDKPILLVTFETVQGLRSLSDASHPIGWDLFKSHGWSHLSIISDGHT